MKKNGYVNNRLRMNKMIKNNINRHIKTKTPDKSINRNKTSQRYLNLYQNEKSITKNMLTPDINGKSIKKKPIYEKPQNHTIEVDFLTFLEKNDNLYINDNINLLSNSFDISKSFVNIEDYMNIFYSKSKNPFLNKLNEESEKEQDKINTNDKIIAKYSYKNKTWFLIENFGENEESLNIYWKEVLPEQASLENNHDIKNINLLEGNYNSLKLEYNKCKQIFNDLKNKYENINKKNKEFQMQLNYYILKIKEIEKEKEKYIIKNKKLKEEIQKIPTLIQQEMKKFKEEAGRKISKKIYDLEQENKILKGEKILINITNGNNDSENNEFKVLKI